MQFLTIFFYIVLLLILYHSEAKGSDPFAEFKSVTLMRHAHICEKKFIFKRISYDFYTAAVPYDTAAVDERPGSLFAVVALQIDLFDLLHQWISWVSACTLVVECLLYHIIQCVEEVFLIYAIVFDRFLDADCLF